MVNKGVKTVVVIAGPTAVGKTDIAVQLAELLHTAVISADSRQCYKGMAIGTAQPSAAELARVDHYFINEFPVEQQISAADYERLALEYLDVVFRRSNYAVVCGGTGLYIKALCEGLDEMPQVPQETEQHISLLYEQNGLAWLQAEVQMRDPAFFAGGEVQNPHRLLRALSFVTATGESITRYRTGLKKQRPFNINKIGLELPREVLYERINLRVDQMMDAGLEREVSALYPLKHLKNLNTVGYSELFDYMDGKCSRNDAIEKIKQHSRNYAKRQLTWFKKDKEFIWLNAAENKPVKAILELLDMG